MQSRWRNGEARAEAAYAAMYDAADHDQKGLKDDALLYLAHAVQIAEALGLEADAAAQGARDQHHGRVEHPVPVGATLTSRPAQATAR